jgi:hypothetical protein
MSPQEVWWLIAAKTPPRMYGDLTEDEASSLYDLAGRRRSRAKRAAVSV